MVIVSGIGVVEVWHYADLAAATTFAAASDPNPPSSGGPSSVLATLALIVSGFSALIALATYLSTKEIRSLDRSTKRLELAKS